MAVLSHEGTYPIMYTPLGVPVGAGYRPGYLARPDQAGRFPVVLVIPGVEGVTSTEKDICRRLARRGLAAVTIEMYRSRSDDPFEDYAALSDRRAITDLDEAHEFLSSDDMEWAHADAIGVFGIDVGGRFALTLAAGRPWVRAVAVAYTPLTGDEDREIQVADQLEHFRVPVMGMYGADDDLIDTETVDEAQRRNEAGQWMLYEGAGHGFLDINGDTYHADAAEDALSRLVQYFTQTLPAAEVQDLG